MSKKMDINVFLHFLLVIKDMNNFTVTEAKDTLLDKKEEFTDDIETRKFIYRQLTRNVEKGLLKRTEKSDSGVNKVIYSKTNLFFTVTVGVLFRKSKVNVGGDKRLKLITKLNHYKAELLLNIGESEAYKEVHSEFPELVDEIKPESNKAKDNNTIILGKIRAVEGLLGQVGFVDEICN
jgi:hypothetical protein